MKTGSRISSGAFGAIAEHYVATGPIFNGTPEEMAQAMERAFVITPRVAKNVLKATAATVAFDRNQLASTELEIDRASHLITNVIKVPEKLRKEFTTNLDRQTRELTAFLVTEIAPYESSIETALVDAAEIVSMITGAQSVSFSLGRSETLLRRLTELKTIDWVCNWYNIPADIRSMLLHEYMGPSGKAAAAAASATPETAAASPELAQVRRMLQKLTQAKAAAASTKKSK